MNYYGPWGPPPPMWGPPQQQPHILYVPTPPPPPPPGPPPVSAKTGKPMSAKQLYKAAMKWEALKKGEDKDKPKEEKKDKKLKDKTFTWFELSLILITWSVPISILTLAGLKGAIVILRSLLLP